jgi:ketosteroid isomerase-like protein
MTTIAIETVLAWHAALNQADVERLLSLSTDNVEVGGPRGACHGADLLRDWLARASVRLEPRRIFCRNQMVVVDQAARWPTADGQRADPQEVASVFRVEDGRVASVLRHLDLASALHAAGLDFSDEHVPTRPSPG